MYEWYVGCIYYMYFVKCFYIVFYLFSIIVCFNFLYFLMENWEKYFGIILYICLMKICRIWKNKKYVEYKKDVYFFVNFYWCYNDYYMWLLFDGCINVNIKIFIVCLLF